MKASLFRARFLKSRRALTTAVYFFALLFSFFGIKYIRAFSLSELYLSALFLIAFFLPLMLYKHTEAGKDEGFALSAFSPRFLPRMLLCLIGTFAISFSVYAFFGKGLTLLGMEMPTPTEPAGYCKVILAFIVIPSFAEEIVLRGAWQSANEARGMIGSLLLSAIMSAAFGFNALSSLYLLILGVCASLVRWQSGSLWGSLLLNLLWRSGVLLLFPFFDPSLLQGGVRIAVLCVGGVTGIVAIFFSLDKKVIKDKLYFSAGDDRSTLYYIFLFLAVASFGIFGCLNG